MFSRELCSKTKPCKKSKLPVSKMDKLGHDLADAEQAGPAGGLPHLNLRNLFEVAERKSYSDVTRWAWE